MFSKEDIEIIKQYKEERIKFDRRHGLVECKRCGGTKNKIAEQSQEVHPGVTYAKFKLEHCYWCNDDGMVDPWNELMGKKWSEYVHKMY